MCADCRDWLPTLADNTADLIATDPPYFRVKTECDWDRQWRRPEEYLAWLDGILAELARILKPNGSLYLFASPQMAARVECLIAERFRVLNRIVWVKTSSRSHEGGRWSRARKESLRSYFPRTEFVIFAEQYGADNIAKGEAGFLTKCEELRQFVFEPIRSYLAEEVLRGGLSTSQVDAAWRKWKKSPKGGMARHWLQRSQWGLPTRANYEWLRLLLNGDGNEHLRREYEDLRREYEDLRREYEDLRREYEDLRRPFSVNSDVPFTDVWSFETVRAYPGRHPCEKPLEMMEHIVRVSSRPGALVLDCFAGSGQTLLAAHRNGRRFFGCEISQALCRRIRRRIETDALPLFPQARAQTTKEAQPGA